MDVLGKRIVFLLVFVLFFTQIPAAMANRGGTSGLKTAGYKSVAFKGEVLSREIARTTGIALNPILCMSAFGAYTYYTTEAAERQALPWHASPQFFGPLALVMFLIFLKDSSKIALPKVLTVPLDALETLLEKKASALLALPMLFSAINSGEYEQVQQISQLLGDFFSHAAIAGTPPGLAVQAGPGILTTLTTCTVVTAVFVVVWVLSHAFDILILLSPFSTFDMVLATTRNGLIAGVVGMAGSPFGLWLSLAICVVAVVLFPRALRLVIFGTVISYDIVVYRLLARESSSLLQGQEIQGFTCCYLSSVPPRTYATIKQNQGQLVITCKTGFFGPQKSIPTGIAAADCALEPGFLSPVVKTKDGQGHGEIRLLRLRPKYHRAVDQVAAGLGVRVARETSLAGKLSAWIEWSASLFKKSPRLEVPVHS